MDIIFEFYNFSELFRNFSITWKKKLSQIFFLKEFTEPLSPNPFTTNKIC